MQDRTPNSCKRRDGFTLIELLIVIGVIAVLATVTALVLNPAELFRQARDTTRLHDLKSLEHVFALATFAGDYDPDGPTYSNSCVGQSNQRVFVSVPSDNGEGTPTPPSGWTYAQSDTANLYNIDSTGWVPVDFTTLTTTVGSSLLAQLPVDPTNSFTSGLYYTYICGSYELNAAFESVKYANELTDDGGDDSGVFELGNDLAISPARTVISNNPPPTVSSISPTTGQSDSTVNISSISGADFLAGATVKLTKSGQSDITGSGFSVSSATIIAGGSFDLTGAQAGTWNVVVTNSDGKSNTLANAFTITAAPLPSPTVTAISPATAQNDAGVNITSITGTNFVSGATVKLTKSGQTDITGTGFTVASATSITGGSFDITSAAVGNWSVVVTNPDTQSGSLTDGFAISAPAAPAPTVISASPATASQGATSQAVTITGTNFVNGATVAFSGTNISVTSTTFVNSTTIDITIDIGGSATTGARSVTVTNPDTQSGVGNSIFTVTGVQQNTGYVLGSGTPTYTAVSGNWTAPANGWFVDDTPPASTSDVAQALAVSGQVPAILYSGFTFNIPAGSTIDGICVLNDNISQAASTAGTQRIAAKLSWDSGSSFTTENVSMGDITSFAISGVNRYFMDPTTAPGSSDPGATCTDWGHAWTVSEMSAANFAVHLRLINTNATATTIRFDGVQVKVYYTP